MSRLLTSCLLSGALGALVPLAAQAQAPGQPAALPDGAGKPLIEAICTQCHQTNMITQSSGYTRDGWQELIGTMINLASVPDQRAAITEYLAEHFAPKYNKRQAKIVPGPVEITFKEWVMPTLGQRARDPIQAADGSIWWAGQFGNLIGRLDPKTGEMREYQLPANSLPHTVELDQNGTPWYTGNKNGTVGKLDPATGQVTVYKMPDPNAKDPHTLIFDKNGVAFFTLQNSNMVGRLDPATGHIKLITVPIADSKPYGIKVDAEGAIWFSCNGAPCLYKMDPQTMALKEYKLPLGGTTVRRLDIAEDGMIWYVNSGKGRIGRLDPKTGMATEWDSPSGPRSHPYAIVVMNGAVWYNESGVRPDPLVRFDIKTETFQSWPIPSGSIFSGIWRHGRSTKEGNLLIHQSATNRIIQVTPKQKAAALQ
jgi:virginiamycin B lyase